MTRSTEEWIGATDDSVPPVRVRARVFERYGGICYKSGRKIRPGDKWQLDHVIAIINGGANRESNLAPILADAHKAKTVDDLRVKKKTARMRAKHLRIWPKSRRPLRSRGFKASRRVEAE